MDFQATLFASEADAGLGPLAPLGGGVERVPLSRGAWVDLRPGFVLDADAVFATMLIDVPWRAEQRPMYDRVVDVPRLVATYPEGAALPIRRWSRPARRCRRTIGPSSARAS